MDRLLNQLRQAIFNSGVAYGKGDLATSAQWEKVAFDLEVQLRTAVNDLGGR